jgi:glycosyltransferase involved in cell wall biosynthesis
VKGPILFLDQQSWRGGAQRVLLNVLDSLRGEFEPIVALPEFGPFANDLEGRNIEIVTYPLGSYRSGQKSLSDMAAFAIRSIACGAQLASFIGKRKVRLVYINGPRCLPAGTLAARFMKIPSIFHLHISLTRRAEIFVASHAAKHVSGIIACSQAAARLLMKYSNNCENKTQIIYNPIDTQGGSGALPRPQADSQQWTVGTVGRITRGKGYHILMRAVGRVRPELRRNLKVMLVGAPAERPEDAAYASYLKRLESELNLQKMIRWEGFQPDPTRYYAAMKVLVVPSDWEFEGMPMAILEAMQWGVPVIASRIGGIPELIHDGVNGLLVTPGDEGALAEALERLAADPALCRRLGEAGRLSIDDRFSPHRFGNKIRELVGGLCSARLPIETTRKWSERTG